MDISGRADFQQEFILTEERIGEIDLRISQLEPWMGAGELWGAGFSS